MSGAVRRAWAGSFAAAVLAFAGCGGAGEGRLSAGDVPTESPSAALASVTPRPSASVNERARQVEKAPRQDQTCRGQAAAFLPSNLPGYTLSGGGGLSGQAPAGTAGVESVALTTVSKVGQQVAAVTSLVFSEAAAADPTQTAVDVYLKTLTGAGTVKQVNVGGLQVFQATAGKNTVYAWQECRNVVVAAAAQDKAVALDVTEKTIAEG